MLKKEFLDVLNQKLSLISDKEREDILLEYGTYMMTKLPVVLLKKRRLLVLAMWMSW